MAFPARGRRCGTQQAEAQDLLSRLPGHSGPQNRPSLPSTLYCHLPPSQGSAVPRAVWARGPGAQEGGPDCYLMRLPCVTRDAWYFCTHSSWNTCRSLLAK